MANKGCPDLKTVCNELDEVKHKAYEIGLQLGIDHSKLMQFKQEGNLLPAALNHWLRGNVPETPTTWNSVVDALRSKQVGEEGLASTIYKKYCCEQTKPEDNKDDEDTTTPALPSSLPLDSDVEVDLEQQHNKKDVNLSASDSSPLHSEIEHEQLRKKDAASPPLSPDIELDLEHQLETNLKAIQEKYADYVDCIQSIVEKRGDGAKHLRSYLLNLSAFDSTTDDKRQLQLLADLRAELLKADEVVDIFTLLSLHFASFLDYDIFETILKKYGTDDDREKLNYRNDLKDYIEKHKISEFELISPKLKRLATDTELIHLKLDIKRTRTLSTLKEVQKAVAGILGVQPSALQFHSVKEGCVIVTLLIPTSIANVLFTCNTMFSPEQECKFRAASVLWLEYNGFKYYDFKISSKKDHSALAMAEGSDTLEKSGDELREDDTKDILPKPAHRNCKLHNRPLNLYCFDCGCPICYDGSVEGHCDHKFQSIKAAATDTRKELIQQLDPLKRTQENLMQAVTEIQTTEFEVEAQGHSIADSVNQAFDELETIIRNHRQEMLNEAAMKVSGKLERLSVQKQDLSMSSAKIKNVIDYTEQCVEHSADDEVMSMHAEIQSRIDREIEEQKKKEKNLKPVEDADMGIYYVSRVEDLKQLICHTKENIIPLETHTKESIIPLEIDCTVRVVSAKVNKKSELRVAPKPSNGEPTKRSHVVECSLKRLACDSITACKVEAMKCGEYRVQYTPTVRGRHELTVTVNGRAVAGSPFPVFVSIPPTQLGKPVQVISTGSDYPYDVAVNSKGQFVVASLNNLCLLDRKGEKVRNFEKRISSQHFSGISVDSTNDHVYAIIYTRPTVEIVKLSSELKLLKPCEVYLKDSLYGLSGVEVVGDEVMVCDQERNCVKVYTKDLEFVREIGRGSEMKSISGLSSDEDGNLYVSDRGKKCIMVFSNAGDSLHSFNVKDPYGVSVAGEHVYVISDNHRVFVLLRTTGQQVASFGQYGGGEGEFNFPSGVCVDKDGFVCVCDYYNHRVQMF